MSCLRPRFLFDVPRSRFVITPVPTRGERLALSRVRFEGEVDGGGGQLAIDYLAIDEVAVDGRNATVVFFDPDDRDAAYAELDDRFGRAGAATQTIWRSGQGIDTLRRAEHALAARDWEQPASTLTEDFVLEDRRVLGWGKRTRDELVAQLRAMVDLAPDATTRSNHVLAIDHHRVLLAARWVGTREGGAFETPLGFIVRALAPDGRIRRLDVYGEEHLAAARAHYDALASEARLPRIAPSRERRG